MEAPFTMMVSAYDGRGGSYPIADLPEIIREFAKCANNLNVRTMRVVDALGNEIASWNSERFHSALGMDRIIEA